MRQQARDQSPFFDRQVPGRAHQGVKVAVPAQRGILAGTQRGIEGFEV